MPDVTAMSDHTGQTAAMARLENALAARYPMFKRHSPSTCCYDDWGLEIGPGWMNLLIEFADKATEQGSTVTLHQVKEKFFQLRIYFVSVPSDFRDDALAELASALEDRSSTICEVCSKQHAGPSDAQTCQHTSEEFIAYCEASIKKLGSH